MYRFCQNIASCPHQLAAIAGKNALDTGEFNAVICMNCGKTINKVIVKERKKRFLILIIFFIFGFLLFWHFYNSPFQEGRGFAVPNSPDKNSLIGNYSPMNKECQEPSQASPLFFKVLSIDELDSIDWVISGQNQNMPKGHLLEGGKAIFLPLTELGILEKGLSQSGNIILSKRSNQCPKFIKSGI